MMKSCQAWGVDHTSPSFSATTFDYGEEGEFPLNDYPSPFPDSYLKIYCGF
jgi:hypothetical protein